MVKTKRGQVWIETVTYTLIAFVMIGLVLSFAKPKIDEYQHKSILEQSSQMLKEIDSIIYEVGEGEQGNKREVELTIKEGQIEISPTTNQIIFTMDSRYLYSEPGEIIQEGDLLIETREKGKFNEVNMTLDYMENFNITQGGLTKKKILSKSSLAYKVFITNKGGTPTNLDIEIN
jgi:hypothetical protein